MDSNKDKKTRPVLSVLSSKESKALPGGETSRTSPNAEGGSGAPRTGPGEEMLVVDARSALRPAQLVEHKLVGLLKKSLLPISHVRLTSMGNPRSHC